MIIETAGNKLNPAILFFHAMGVTGESSTPVAEYLKEKYYCIMPTSTVYCKGQKYISKDDEIRQIEEFLSEQGVNKLALVVASSIGADLALRFLTSSEIKAERIFFDGGQFAQINRFTRIMMTPFLYLTIKSLYWSKGKTLKYILWSDDDSIKPYFIKAGKNLTYRNLYYQLLESLENKPFPEMDREMQENTFFEFGSIEDHFKYRENVMKSYKYGRFPVFNKFNHMQYQIENPEGFSAMLEKVIVENKLPELDFLRE